MINSINGGSPMQRPPEKNTPLSDENTSLIKETLEQFDAENLTEQDMLSIVNTFSEAGIEPSKAMAELMAESGFDAREIGDVARKNGESSQRGDQGMAPPPPLANENQMSNLLDFLEEQLEGKELNSLNSDERTAIISQIVERFGIPEEDTLLSIKV